MASVEIELAEFKKKFVKANEQIHYEQLKNNKILQDKKLIEEKLKEIEKSKEERKSEGTLPHDRKQHNEESSSSCPCIWELLSWVFPKCDKTHQKLHWNQGNIFQVEDIISIKYIMKQKAEMWM